MPLYTIDNRELKRSLNLVIFSLGFGMVFFTVFGVPVGSSVFTGFMRKLGAGDLVYSVIMALPVLGAVSQIFASYYLETTGRRKSLFIAAGLFHRLLWIPVALLPLFIGTNMHTACIWFVTVLITASSVAYSINGIAFNSWMGSLVPADITGRFFSVRTLVSTITGAVAAIAVGIFVDRVDSLTGFAIVFIIGALFGVVDIVTFFFVSHPPLIPPEHKPSLRSIFLDPFKNPDYLKVCLFATMFAFAVNVPSPFFNVYMIENLRMNYLVIALSVQIMSSLTTVLCVRRWGVLADRYGNRPIVLVSAIGIAALPLMWMLSSPTFYFMVYVTNFLGGIFWSGYNLAIYNQSVWLAPERSRSAYIACFTMLTSVIGTAFAYICGGYFMQYAGPAVDALRLPFVLGRPLNSYQALFIVSAILRFIAIFVFFPMVREKNASSVSHMVKDVLQPMKEWRLKR
ncbi:MAG: MFS transporter [Clostridia bacterium]|nr:MFS transporter [Clostridia bacterium]MDR3644197.1 MFS transporter [Clostridia bacterium]